MVRPGLQRRSEIKRMKFTRHRNIFRIQLKKLGRLSTPRRPDRHDLSRDLSISVIANNVRSPCGGGKGLGKQLILIRVYSSIKSRRGSRESGRVSFGAHDYPAALVTPRWSPFPQTNCRLNGGEIPRRRDPLAVFDLACYVPLHTNRVLFSRTLFFSLSLSFSLFSLFCLGYASVQGGGSPPLQESWESLRKGFASVLAPFV